MIAVQTIYLTDNGIQLKRRSNRIVMKKEGKILEEIPVLDMKRIVIFGNNQLSTELMHFLADKGVEVAFLSYWGKFKFRIVPENTRNIYLRMAQHDLYRDRDFRASLSRTVVKAKLGNQRSLLIRYQRNRPEVDLQVSVAALKDYIDKADQADSVERLMGMEGIGSKVYFESYGKLLSGGFDFKGREYYPPPDPVNALLSFGYMLLFNEMLSLLEAFGLDVYLGFLHSVRPGRASLASDMMEDLRSPVIDRLVLYLINKGVVKPDQFTVSEEEKKKGIRMDDAARKAFLTNYERFMTARFQDPGIAKRVSYREIMKEKVGGLECALLNRAELKPYLTFPKLMNFNHLDHPNSSTSKGPKKGGDARIFSK